MTENDRAPISPSARRVAQRALVLTAISCRGFLEQEATAPASQAMLDELIPWLESVGAAPEIEPAEREQLATALGALDKAGSLIWQVEAAAAMAWALGLAEMPPLFEQVEPRAVGQPLGFLAPRQSLLPQPPQLRPPAELAAAASRYLTVHWRLRDFQLRPRRMDFRAFVAGSTWGPLTLEGLELMEDDLAVHRMPIDSYQPAELLGELGIVAERHRALDWLNGHATLYSDATGDT